MADGEASSIIDLIVSLKTEGLGKIDKAKDKVNESMESMTGSSEETQSQMGELNESVNQNAEAVDELGTSFMQATGQGLALLFAGRFLSQTFGGLSRTMFDMLGVTDMFSAMMKTILLPAFLAIQPVLMRIMERFMEMDESTKMIIGSFVILATALAPIIMILGQIMAGMAAFGIGASAVVAALSTLGSVLAAVAGALAILWVGFEFGMDIVRNFRILIDGLKTNFQLFVGMVKRLMRGEWRSAWGMFKAIVSNSIDTVKKIFLNDLINFLENTFPNLTQSARNFASNFADAITDFIGDAVDKVKGWIEDIKNGLASIPGAGMAGGAMNFAANRVNDFVISDGRVLKTHPNDVLFGMKNPEQLGRGGGGQNITINVDRPQLNNEMDVDKMIERVKRDLDRDTRGRSGLR